MFKPIASLVNSERIQQPSAGETSATINRLFMLFHGWYGNLFLSKFATGERDESGKDKGIKSARIVWTSELREFDAETVMRAAKRCRESHVEFPPSLPQFVAICKAVQPRQSFSDVAPSALEMSQGLKSSYTRQARAQAMTRYHQRMAEKTGHIEVSPGLSGLAELVAKAVALAGGDEVQVLQRLNRAFTPTTSGVVA